MLSVWIVYNHVTEIVCETKELAEAWAAEIRKDERGVPFGKTRIDEKSVYRQAPSRDRAGRLETPR